MERLPKITSGPVLTEERRFIIFLWLAVIRVSCNCGCRCVFT